MKRICALLAIVWVMFVLLPSLGLPEGSAPGEKEGIALRKEADELRTKARSKEDREKALETYEKALEIFRRAGSSTWQGTTLNNIGLIYVSISQYHRALEYYDKALSLHRKAGNAKEEATTLANMGSAYRFLGQFQKALEYQEKALTLHRKISNLRGEGWALDGLSFTYRGMGQYQKALECSEKSLAISRKLNNMRDEGNVLVGIGYIYWFMGEYQKGLENYEKGLEIDKRTGNVHGEGIAMGGIGSVYFSLGQYKRAIECHERAAYIQKTIGNQREEAIQRNDTANVYRAWGQYQKALENYEKALEILRKIGEVKEEATTLNNVARIYFWWGRYQKALEYCNKALASQRGIGARQGEVWSYGLMGTIYQASGQLQGSLDSYEKACELARTIGDQRSEADDYSNIGGVCFAFAKYDDALKNYQKALEIYEKIGAPTDAVKAQVAWTYMEKNELDKAEKVLKETKSNWALGKLHLLKFDYDKAKTNYERLLTAAEKSGDTRGLFTAYTGLGKVYEGLEYYKNAEEYYEKGMKLTEEIRSGLLPSERKSFFEVKVNGFERSEPAKGLTRVRMKLNKAAGSIDSSEATRARAFSDGIALRSERGVAGVPGDVLEKETDLVAKGAALKTERGKVMKDKNPEGYSNMTKEVEIAEAELNGFVEMLWNKHTAYAAVKYPRPVTLKESSLRQNEYAVMFDVSTEGVGVKLIKGKTIAETYYKRWKLDDLEEEIRRFRQPFEQADLRKFDPELAESLYKGLLARVLMEVPKGTPIVIIPDGILAVLPFEALVVDGKVTWRKGQWGDYPAGITYLGDVYPISYYQSITALTLARSVREKRQPGDRLLVIADPVFLMQDARAQGAKPIQEAKAGGELYSKLMAAIEEQGGGGFRFDRLPQTGALAEDLRTLYGDKADVYTGLKADKASFLTEVAPNLDRYGQILFATHGVFTNQIPGIQEPFLAMSMVPPGTDGFLKMSDVMSLKMNADMVALTACQTGLGKELSGEGVLSMGRAFQYAGARSILMSLWSVAEETSTMLAENFFRHLREGKTKLEALKAARDEVRKEGAEHPFFWAPFILVGETD